MPSTTLPSGPIHFRVAGPDNAALPPVVFVHGFLVDGTLWSGVAEQLALAGVRSFAPDWPLGSHTTPAAADADLSPRGVAGIVISFLEALDLSDVTLVGNDSGGAICQLLLDTDASRIGRVVLTNCDAFENFPPKVFLPLFAAAKRPRLLHALLQPIRLRLVRHSPLAFGLLLRRPRDAELTRRWLQPALNDRRIRDDIVRFARGLDRRELVEVAPRLRRFPGPVRIVWGLEDRCFPVSSARRLVDAFADATLVEVPGASTFVSVDEPAAVAAAILEVSSQRAGSRPVAP